MNVSVVICAYTLDRWNALEASVQSCINQSEPPSEIVVVIDYNEELFQRASAAFGAASVVKNVSTKGLSGARNSGVIASSSEVIAFLDDDAFADPTWLEELTRPLADPLVCGSGGWVVPFWETGDASWFPETFYWVLGCSFSGLPMTDGPIRNPIGANMAIRRGVFDAVGGFTSGIGRIGATPLGCEETELCIRYAKRHPKEHFMLARRAVVHHRVPSSRLNWHYFWTRCWAEGLSKAAVSSLVGTKSGLAAERSHVVKAIPREIARSLRSIRDEPRAALIRVSLIVAGALIAAAGFLRGTRVLRRLPLAGANDQSTSLASLSHLNHEAEPAESRIEDRGASRGPVRSIDES